MTGPIAIVGGTAVDAESDRTGPDTLQINGSVIAAHDNESIAEHQIDASGLLVAPGFIDLQVNGGYGFDLVENPINMWNLGPKLAQHGVTAFLPTIISSPAALYPTAIEALAARPNDYIGPDPVGLHFEGPMLNTGRAGAHRVKHLVAPDPSVIEGWSADAGVRLVTLAPELEGADEVIAALVQRGVVVSAGHSMADADEARAAAGRGVTMITHIFNAMEPLRHRAPGLVGVGLTDRRLSVGLIADGVHVDPAVVDMIWRTKGPSGIVLVTDAVAAMGLGPGRFNLGDFTVIADDTKVQTPDGTLAGSILTMDAAVRNLVDFTGSAPADVLATATTTPAKAIGLERRGNLNVGSRADIVLLDRELNVVITICGGAAAYIADHGHDRLSPSLHAWAEALPRPPT